jgi:LacI family transcriptional regulator
MGKAEQVCGMGNTLRFIAFTNSCIVLEQYAKQPFFMELLCILEEQCRSRGYALMYSAVDMQNVERDLDKYLGDSSAGGNIRLGTNLNPEQIRTAVRLQPNLVILDTCFETLDANFIVMNNRKGAFEAGDYLCRLGHKKIGYVQSSVRMYNYDTRRRGFFSALAEHGLKVNETDIFTVTPTLLSLQHEFKQPMRERLERGEALPTALFCEYDYIAISVIKSLHEIGLRIPHDISFVGFDNITEAMVISPELTTIPVEKERIAALAVDKLIDILERKDTVKIKTFVDTRPVERKSCRRLEE